MRPLRWVATSTPALCRRLQADASAEAVWAESQARSLRGSAMVIELLEHAQLIGALADALAATGLYWVRPAMMELAMQASHDAPRVVTAQAIEPEGFLLLEKPLPPLPLPDIPDHRPIRPSGFVWHRHEMGMIVHVLARSSAGVAVWASQHDLVPVTAILIAGAEQDLTAAAAQDMLLAWLMSAWTLMVEPTLSDRRTIDPAPGTEGAGRTWDTRSVTLVDLRRIRRRPIPAGDGSHELHHRFMVRGHWRQQYHPSDRSHRLRWIAPYMKGPDGAPLLLTDQVMVWRR
ncbi:MAG: hypothetical protein QM628_00185 [Propionicimonas sp.]